MKILVDHGAWNNHGDIAMLEAVVERFQRGSDAAEAHVIRHLRQTTRLWENPRVTPVDFRFVQPLIALGPFMRTRFLWRWSNAFAGPWMKYCFASLGRRWKPDTIRVVEGPSDVSLQNWCRGYDGYLVVGGGNLTDAFPGEVWRRCCLIHAFADQGKPVVLSGQQIGPFRSRVMGEALAHALRRSDFVGLREPTASVAFCEQAGLPPDRYAVMGDDSFGLGAESPSRVEAILERIGLSRGRFLAVNVRIAAYSPIEQAQLQEVAELVSSLSDHYGLPILAVPISLNEGESDLRAAHRLAEAIGGERVRVLDDPGLTPSFIKGILGRAFGAVGVSYHFCTFSLSQGVPAVCLHHGDYYGQKGSGLCRLWGSDRLSLPLGRVSHAEAIAQIRDVFDDERFREALKRHAVHLVQDWEATFDSRILGTLFDQRPRSRTAERHAGETLETSIAESS